MRDVLKYVSDDAAAFVYKYSDKIAKQLFKIAEIPDLTVNMVKDAIFQFLNKKLDMDAGLALEIADGVKRALNIILF
ncbi:hypothetical protein ABE137_25300 [Brevibacillus laterosporus]|nr:hypothetical protein J5TS2_37230 [Brevibacillus halotolerans]